MVKCWMHLPIRNFQIHGIDPTLINELKLLLKGRKGTSIEHFIQFDERVTQLSLTKKFVDHWLQFDSQK